MARVYLPMGVELLRRLHDEGHLPDGVERLVAASDDEEDEYAALAAAADESALLLRGRGREGRRVVAVAEVADADGPVAWRDLVAVHVDERDLDPSAARPPELGWYAVQEVTALLGPG